MISDKTLFDSRMMMTCPKCGRDVAPALARVTEAASGLVKVMGTCPACGGGMLSMPDADFEAWYAEALGA